ncbi:MAG: hypothetical protein M3Q58_03695 [Bacteroidota bacterium]|nr:hypothetical protein [Bacteroidota bacterium]
MMSLNGIVEVVITGVIIYVINNHLMPIIEKHLPTKERVFSILKIVAKLTSYVVPLFFLIKTFLYSPLNKVFIFIVLLYFFLIILNLIMDVNLLFYKDSIEIINSNNKKFLKLIDKKQEVVEQTEQTKSEPIPDSN